MGFMQAVPRSRQDKGESSWRHLGAMCALAGLVTACGGGGGDSPSSGDPGSSTATPGTRIEAVVGDYFIYESTQTAPVSASAPPYLYVQTIRSMAADGTHQRVHTYTNSSVAQQNTYNVNDALLTADAAVGSSAVACVYSPASTTMPPYPRSVGQTWGGTYTTSCSGSPAATYTVAGRIEAREQLTLPAGTFDAYRAVRTADNATTTSTFHQAATCWFSVQRGVLLRCDFTSTFTPLNSSTPGTSTTITQVLSGVGGPARSAMGDVQQRFAGSWRVQYTGGASGTCPSLRVSATGVITGNCVPTGSTTSFAVTGSVNIAGAVTIALPTGGTLSGSLANPYAGSGTWVDGSASGTWTAAHN